jgi:hypothetical protein
MGLRHFGHCSAAKTSFPPFLPEPVEPAVPFELDPHAASKIANTTSDATAEPECLRDLLTRPPDFH